MTIAEIKIGTPFIYRENPDVKPRLFYRMYAHITGYTELEFKYECYEVVNGCLQTPSFLFPEDTIVEPYEFKKR